MMRSSRKTRSEETPVSSRRAWEMPADTRQLKIVSVSSSRSPGAAGARANWSAASSRFRKGDSASHRCGITFMTSRDGAERCGTHRQQTNRGQQVARRTAQQFAPIGYIGLVETGDPAGIGGVQFGDVQRFIQVQFIFQLGKEAPLQPGDQLSRQRRSLRRIQRRRSAAPGHALPHICWNRCSAPGSLRRLPANWRRRWVRCSGGALFSQASAFCSHWRSISSS